MRRVHPEAMERVGANRLGQNGMRGRVHREGLDGTGDGNEAWRTAQQMNTTTHSVLTQSVGSHAFCCLPMNTTHSVASR